MASNVVVSSARGKKPGFLGALRRILTNRFDARLAAELATQRKPVLKGLACTVVIGSTAAVGMSLLKYASESIETLGSAAKASSPLEAHRLTTIGLRELYTGCLAVIVLYLFRYWFVRGQTYYLTQASNRLAANLRIRLFAKLLRLPIGYYNERRSGAIQSVLTNDVNVYQTAVGIIRDSVQAPISAIGAFGYIIYHQWQVALLALPLIPAMAAVIQRNARKMRQAQGQVQRDLSEVSATTLEVLNGARVVKAFGAEERTKQEYNRLVESTYTSQMRATGVTAALKPLVDVIGSTALSAAFLTCGLLALHNSLKISDVLAIGYGMDIINQGFRSLGGVTNTLAMVDAASGRIYSEILDVPEQHEVVGGKSFPDPKGRIVFEDVSFNYPDGTQALRNVNFVLEPGTSLALVGPSGAGKSTIADLVLRFYDPTSGRILFDGVDLRDLDIAWLRAQLGVVPQQTFLFANSIEENVKLGAPDATDEELQIALKQAYADQFAEELKLRPTADLGERGVRLSGGQMQRVAIARALIRKPTVLVLDEATSALDANSEKVVTEALTDVMRSRTTLFIAHRLTTAARADKILVLSRGEVVETGSHAELLEEHGVYAGLFRAFSGGVLA